MPLERLNLDQVSKALDLHYAAATIDAYIVDTIVRIVAQHEGRAVDKRLGDAIREALKPEHDTANVKAARAALDGPRIMVTMEYDGSNFKIDTNWYRHTSRMGNEPGSSGGVRVTLPRSRDVPRKIGNEYYYAHSTVAQIDSRRGVILERMVRDYNAIVDRMKDFRRGLDYPFTSIFADH